MSQPKVAIIGAGPGGLVAARYLQSEGFEPVLFEQSARIGGQWSGQPRQSGVWPSMRTNTSRIMTSFSDLPHDPRSPTYPTNQAMGDYLQRYADLFNLMPHIRLNTPVRELRRDTDGGWIVGTDGGQEHFDGVVIASGRYHKPMICDLPGLDTFSGSAGVSHAFDYQHPEAFRGLRVLVVGCSISSLEIASDLAMNGTAHVVASNRKQRYVLPKIVAGVPLEHLAFTRFGALAGESFPMEAVAAAMKEFALGAAGNPEQFGAPKASDNIFEAGITQSQFYLPLVAEGRIIARAWIERVDGQTVHFADGSSEDFDAIVFGTGYDLDLPFVSDEIRQTLDLDAQHIDLYHYTFHPELPGLAFLGLYEMAGPYYPVLELQARWVAYTFSGAVPSPAKDALEAGVAAYRARRGGPQTMPMHVMALMFARAAQVEPDVSQWPGLVRSFFFGPLAPVSFRMTGKDSLPEAADRFAAEAAAFGCVPSGNLTPMQAGQMQALAQARGDEGFARFVGGVAP